MCGFTSCSSDDDDNNGNGNNGMPGTFKATLSVGKDYGRDFIPNYAHYEYIPSSSDDDKGSSILHMQAEGALLYIYFNVESYKNKQLSLDYVQTWRTSYGLYVSGSFTLVDLTDKTITFEFKDYKIKDRDTDNTHIMNGKITVNLKK